VHGMTALITGATDGLGRAVAGELSARGARVLVHGRDAGRAREVAQEVGSEHVYLADLASLDEVRRLAAEVAAMTMRWTCSSVTRASAPRCPATARAG
jgi:NAD(P)-dependent dehydrogenase (short-subunit alcohol dehydrogenase family)